MKKKVIIIGAGIGGLATGALLGKMGFDVTILEKNKSIGGRAMRFKSKGFTFDMGPSWYLMPDVFERYFKLFRKKPSDFFRLKRLDPQYRIFFTADDFVDIRSSIKENYKLFDSIEPGSSAKIREYLNHAKFQYRIAMDEFVYKNYLKVTDFLNPTMVSEGPKLHVFESLDKYITRYTTNDKLRKILQYSMVFLGGSTKNTPALYSIMSHIDFHMGVFYPVGGIYSIIEALETLCRQYNVTIKTNQEVNRIGVEKNRATIVETAHKKYAADIVVSNADYPFTEVHLLEPKHQTYPASYWSKKTIAPSAFILHLGIRGKLKKLKHHNLFFADDWETHFDEIFTDPKWPDKPSYYVCCPTKSDTTVAPRGHENIFVLVPIASGLEDNEEIRKQYAARMLAHLESLAGEPIKKRIVTQRIFSLRDYQTLYNSYKGTALGLTHTLFQTAIFRPANRSKKVKNLYYVGQYTVPGVGMPMCLISSQLVAERIRNEQ